MVGEATRMVEVPPGVFTPRWHYPGQATWLDSNEKDMIKPICFCKPKVDDCPKCSKTDYSKVKPPSGSGNKGAMLKARLYLRTVAA